MASPARAAAEEVAALLDTPFLRALAEPARLEVLKVLLLHGAGDVASLAAHLPQDRSVVSRHLQTLEDAGIVRSTWEGRHRRYALDGNALIARFELLSTKLRSLAPLCCPPIASAQVEAPAKPAASAAKKKPAAKK
ncbi:ArsR/SmtB family transcription factor [Nannocystaceae bacterium ST9]